MKNSCLISHELVGTRLDVILVDDTECGIPDRNVSQHWDYIYFRNRKQTVPTKLNEDNAVEELKFI